MGVPGWFAPRPLFIPGALALLLMIIPGCFDYKGGRSIESDLRESTGIRVEEKGPPESRDPQRETEKIDKIGPRISALDKRPSEPAIKPPIEPVIEKLDGYGVWSEYFMIPSKRNPDAVTAVTLPEDYFDKPGRNYPLVLVFGGAGECARPPRQGALAWVDYYSTDEAIMALGSGQLKPSDFKGLAKSKEVRYFNEALNRKPYQGVILACPASPPLMVVKGVEYKDYEDYIIRELIPALKAHYRVGKAAVGIDGVSMGGARSMYYGLKYPEIFRSIGSVQAAVGPFMDQYKELAINNREILKSRQIQMVTSDRDPMARSVERMRNMLRKLGIPVRFMRLTGPHDYIFNEGPGAISLLIFHDSALWSLERGPQK